MNEQMALFKEEIEKKVKVKEEPKAEIKEEPIDYEEIFEKLDLPNGFKDLKDSYNLQRKLKKLKKTGYSLSWEIRIRIGYKLVTNLVVLNTALELLKNFVII